MGNGTRPKAPGEDASDADVAKLVERRGKIRTWWAGKGRWNDAGDPRQPVGLALSGGGIRSATFSLGLLQGLAKAPRDALPKIDVLSTVSGGGYIGCFLRGLFMPGSRRGIAADQVVAAGLASDTAEQYRLARRALGSGPDERQIDWRWQGTVKPTPLRNPLWWLREHSRYLAPTGPTDYGFAVAYLARNWLAMVYLFMLACTGAAVLLVIAEALAVVGLRHAGFGAIYAIPASPLFMLAWPTAALSVALNIAYWATQAMSTNEPKVATQRTNLHKAAASIVVGAIAAMLLVATVLATTPLKSGVGFAPLADLVLGPRMKWIFAIGIVLSLIGAAIAVILGFAMRKQGSMLTAELRLTLTGALAVANRWLLIFLTLGLLDSLGAGLDHLLRLHPVGPGRLSWGVALPMLAFLIKKLPDWFGGPGNGSIGGIVKRFASSIALIAGLVLYGFLAVIAVAFVHHVAWDAAAWVSAVRWPRLIVLAGIVFVLAAVSGRASGFINLSSLHSLYSARLTRAYLGASNVERLKLAAAGSHPTPITENHLFDYIQPRIYGETDLPAPIHIINVTLNETIDPNSQIVARDRKGDILSLEPSGIRIGSDLIGWTRLTNNPPEPGRSHAENVSLGQWCAISGAAASSGMGRMTNLGFALAFTFANVRLGYWWWAPNLCDTMAPARGFSASLARYFGTFVYLANEMTCRYSRGYARKYLTDGGHYENSGAYALIRRRVPFILVTDNGADPGYDFDDLETLVRQVRIDLGGETTILSGNPLKAFLGTLGATDFQIFVDPHARPDWRQRMTMADDPAYVLALRVTIDGEQLHLLWIKPRLLPDLPTDVAGYAATMKAFPQQSTGDQFFDEAQWESYRRLGEASMTRLLETCPTLLA